MEDLLKFIKNQKLLVIATADNNDTWVANVFYGADDNLNIYFISPHDNKHSKMISKNPVIAFSISWFDSTNHKNRKAVQGLGQCHPAKDDEELKVGVELHNKNFPEFKERITFDWIKSNDFGSTVWVLKPSYMKYWDDEIYGQDETKEFNF